MPRIPPGIPAHSTGGGYARTRRSRQQPYLNNGQFKSIFDCQRPVPTRGLLATRRYVLGAVFVYQLTLLARAQAGRDLRVGLKPFLQAA
jgi:hypothetical protein